MSIDFRKLCSYQPPPIRPEVAELVSREAPITLEEWKAFRGNSSEAEAIVPRLNDEAFLEHAAHILKEASASVYPQRPFVSYSDAAIGLILPEMIRRLSEKSTR